jgi:hypothetical protein
MSKNHMKIYEKYSNLYRGVEVININPTNDQIINSLYDSFKLGIITTKELGEMCISCKDKNLSDDIVEELLLKKIDYYLKLLNRNTKQILCLMISETRGI